MLLKHNMLATKANAQVKNLQLLLHGTAFNFFFFFFISFSSFFFFLRKKKRTSEHLNDNMFQVAAPSLELNKIEKIKVSAILFKGEEVKSYVC